MSTPYPEYCRIGMKGLIGGFFEEAANVAREGLRYYPDNVPLLEILAAALYKQNFFYEACCIGEKAIELDPDNVKCLAVMASAYTELGLYKPKYFDRVFEVADQSNAVDDKNSTGSVAKAFCALTQYDYEKAFEYAQDGLRRSQDSEGAMFNISLPLLASERWEEGWFAYDKNLEPRYKDTGMPDFHRPLWSGEPGKIIVAGEQGIGDELLFASMIPDLQKHHEIIIESSHKIDRLLARSFNCPVYPTRGDHNAQWKADNDADWWVPMGSLGASFRTKTEDFPGTPFLKADPERRLQWRAVLDSLPDKPKIGIAWSGGMRRTGENKRSMSLTELYPILEYDAEWISLQYRDAEDLPDFIHHWSRAAESDDYEDVAALLSELDLFISVATAAVYCAGGLGVKTWCLVPDPAPWRYGREGDSMPWFNSIELLRKRDGEWAVQQVCEKLSAMGIEKCRDLSILTPVTVQPLAPSGQSLSPLLLKKPGLERFLITGVEEAA